MPLTTTDGHGPKSVLPRQPGAPRPGSARHDAGWFRRVRDRRRAQRVRRNHERAARRTWFGRHPKTTALLAVLVALTPVWWSLGSFMANPANGPFGGRFVEWVRDHGGNGIVVWVENWWYAHHPPPTGGKPKAGAIPSPKGAGATTPNATVAHLPVPSPIAPLASPPIPGEGLWHPAGRLVHGIPAVYESYLRPDPVHTSVVDGVMWMDPTLLRATLYSGSQVPGNGPWHYTAPVGSVEATSLVAAFNSGFRMSDALGGYYSEGREVVPLRTGAATAVIYTDGTMNIGAWGTEVTRTPEVVAARQNLHLLVDNGAPVPGLNANDTSEWGFTLHNDIYVWRSGVGITGDRAIVYVGGPGLNITTLADLLVRAGAMRAMELDINTAWVNAATYGPSTPDGAASAANGTNLITGMAGGTSRYFSPWYRDFFTMSAR
ncbi:MAG TPA: phosphodiester glycosidase family protein [Acidimicrobiales bacterium]|nr:phosphodiester glycosidase family protein [Acidimicrobiales bacterium]